MIIILILTIIVCALLVLVILVQNSKGGGLAAGFSSQSQVMGVKRTADFLEKATWGLAGALLVLSLVSSMFTTGGSDVVESEKSGIQEMVEEEAVALPQGFNPNEGAQVPQE